MLVPADPPTRVLCTVRQMLADEARSHLRLSMDQTGIQTKRFQLFRRCRLPD